MAVSAFMPGTANAMVLGRRRDHGLGRRRLEAGLKPLAQRVHPRSMSQVCGSRRGTKAGDCRHVFGSRTPPALLPAAPDQRLGYMDVAAADKCTRALRAAKLVGRNADEVGIELCNVAIRMA